MLPVRWTGAREPHYGHVRELMDDISKQNRIKKVEGRAKRRKYVQGTRAFTHAMTNSIARRADEPAPKPARKKRRTGVK